MEARALLQRQWERHGPRLLQNAPLGRGGAVLLNCPLRRAAASLGQDPPLGWRAGGARFEGEDLGNWRAGSRKQERRRREHSQHGELRESETVRISLPPARR